MKGFIEVTPQYFDEDTCEYVSSGHSCLVNINRICEVRKNTIYYNYNNDLFNKKQSYVSCVESSEEIKEKIKEAIDG